MKCDYADQVVDDMAKSLESWLGKNIWKMADKPYVLVEFPTERTGLRWMWCGNPPHPLPGDSFAADELPGMLLDCDLKYELNGWDSEEPMGCNECLGVTLYFGHTRDRSSPLSPNLVETLHALAKRGEESGEEVVE